VYKQAGVHYFKQRVVEEMDVTIGDIKSEITDRQRYLLLQLEDALLDRYGVRLLYFCTLNGLSC